MAEKAGMELYRLDLWQNSLGEWPVYPYAFDETIWDSPKPFSYSTRTAGYMSITLLLDGMLKFRCDNSPECNVGAGELYVVPANASRSFSTAHPRRYRKLAMLFKGSLLPALCKELQLDRPTHLKIHAPAELEAKMRELGALMKAAKPETASRMIAMSYEMLVDISMSFKVKPGNSLLALAKHKMEHDFAADFSISKLSSELAISRSMLDRLFRLEVGIPPLKYRSQRKMEEARRLLEHSPLSIKEIALRLGYSNQLYFSTDFRKACGVSPRAYRRSLSD